MLKFFATEVTVSKGANNTPALKFSDKGDFVRFRIGAKVYDARAEKNHRWVNLTVKAFGPLCERIRKMDLKEGSHINLCGRYDEDVWEDENNTKKSMMDIYLAEKLFRSIPANTRLILVGDSDQLPSVGPGAVLKEIIASNVVPVVRLDQVFRQKNGSRIAANAKLIRHGNLSLEYGPDFEFHDSTDLSVSAEIIESLYLQETAKYGIDNVILLSPYRQKTETGVNALNQRLRTLSLARVMAV